MLAEFFDPQFLVLLLMLVFVLGALLLPIPEDRRTGHRTHDTRKTRLIRRR